MFYGRREKRQAEQAEHGWRGVRISTREASHEIMTGGETPSIVQDQIGQHFGPYSEFSVVVDQSHCSEFVHEVPDKSLAFIGSAEARHPCASGNVPAILCDEWSEAQVKAFRLLANRSVTWAEWDDELVALEIADLEEMGFDLSLTGFDADEIEVFQLAGQDGLTDENEVPEPRAISVTRPGDLWILEFGGDSLRICRRAAHHYSR